MTTSCTFKEEKHTSYVLKNKNLQIHVDLPEEGYKASRFDWTGKITAVKYKGIYVSGTEKLNHKYSMIYGEGFYNEFGIDRPIGFEDIKQGDYFHKIGIGRLKKEGEQYQFSKNYEIEPAKFNITEESNKLIIECSAPNANGYSYELKKEIELLESGFVIRYHLRNTGEKTIMTNEYTHNFLAINRELMGSHYILRFPFQIKPESFGATVNPEGKVIIGQKEISFNETPNEQFFFSNLSGNENIEASWELINTKSKIGISEKASFKTPKVNVWGWKHVISPELFFDINVEPNQVVEWSRTYTVFEIN
ncbi:hypothetical protein HNS38_06260 [Lentimicrobium sp. L6]|nr:hypothetical protein [Lentimicrobium sp. S6]NPD84351.1 hypothetical protein [Lentimicrobium sp. L6]